MVEMLNLKVRARATRPVKLHHRYAAEEEGRTAA
jgi:hypothetical protein